MSDNNDTSDNDGTHDLGPMGHYILSSTPGPDGQKLRTIIFVVKDDNDTENSVPRTWTLRNPRDDQLSAFFNHSYTSYFPPTAHLGAMQSLGAVSVSGYQKTDPDTEAWNDYPRPWTDTSCPERLLPEKADNEAQQREGRGRYTQYIEMDATVDPGIRAYRTLSICVFERPNAPNDPPDVFVPIPCYLLTNPSLAEIQTFWHRGLNDDDDGTASYAIMEALGAQHIDDIRQSSMTEQLFLIFYRDTSRDKMATMFCYDDPRGGFWALDLQGEAYRPYHEEVMSGTVVGPEWKLFERFGGKWHEEGCECEGFEEVKKFVEAR
ncbi:MAG: hypothetical protein L6R35_007061 [Caloplaca aegaea]|nr:MAG: hypothetical protein L6R35_007061 [Caloplaca aegaea]